MADEGYLAEYDALARKDPVAALAVLAGWLRTDWRALFAELRERRPVLVTPAFALVTRFEDVTQVLSRPEAFTVRPYAAPMDAALGGGPIMLTRDGTAMNWREKGLVQAVLAPEDVPALRDFVAAVANEALDVAHGSLEVVGGLFRKTALRVCEEYFGLAGAGEQNLSAWSRAVMTDVTANFARDPAVRAASAEAGARLMAFARSKVAERRAAPGRSGADALDRLLGIKLPDELGFDDERVAVNVAGWLLGFVENAAGSSLNIVMRLLADPDLREQAVAAAVEPDRFEPYVWEALRFDPFLKMIVRLCEREHVLASGQTVPAGTPVLAAVASAMFDERAVADPDEFRLDRPAHTRLHFGHGPHACAGVHVGRTVVAETVRQLMLRPGLRLPPGGEVVRDRDVFPDRFVLELDASVREGARS